MDTKTVDRPQLEQKVLDAHRYACWRQEKRAMDEAATILATLDRDLLAAANQGKRSLSLGNRWPARMVGFTWKSYLYALFVICTCGIGALLLEGFYLGCLSRPLPGTPMRAVYDACRARGLKIHIIDDSYHFRVMGMEARW